MVLIINPKGRKSLDKKESLGCMWQGGCGTKNSIYIEQVSKSITEIVSETTQVCQTVSNQTQNVSNRNSGATISRNVNVKQSVAMDIDCVFEKDVHNKLINKIALEIENTSSATGQPISFSKTENNVTQKTKSIVKNAISKKNVQKMFSAITQDQNAVFDNSGFIAFDQINVTQEAEVLAAATIDLLEKAGVFAEFDTNFVIKSASETDGWLDWLTELFSGQFLIFIVVVVAMAGGGYYLFGDDIMGATGPGGPGEFKLGSSNFLDDLYDF